MFYQNVILFLSVSFQISLVNGGVVRSDELYELNLIHYNDFHARFEETTVTEPRCYTNDSNCLGGFARLHYAITSLKRDKPDALVLDAGDVFQGTYWYTILRWSVTQQFINLLPNDAHTLGNHEFDDKVAGLVPYLKALKAPVVVANLNITLEPSLEGLTQPSIVVERKGRKIGIIGVITPSTSKSSSSENVIFLDPIESVKTEALKLTEDGVDIIIVLSHCGLQNDELIAKEAGENIDVIVGGHSHSLLWNGTAPTKEEIVGPYPVTVESSTKKGHKVLIVTASAFTKYLGNLTVYFNKEGEMDTFDAKPIFLDRSIPESPEIIEIMKPIVEKLHAIVDEIIGYANGTFAAQDCYNQECALGDFIADQYVYNTKKRFTSVLPHISLVVASTIRESLLNGTIRRADVNAVFPFSNNVETFILKGRHVVEAIEHSISSFDEKCGSRYLTQIGGMKATLNGTGGRVIEALIQHNDGYKPIEEDADYQVTTIQFISSGGLDFKMIKDNKLNPMPLGIERELLEEYVKLKTPLSPVLDNRLTILK